MKNIYIVGPVASGKNTLLEKIKDNYNVIALDTGQIYRYITLKIFDKIKDQIDINLIQANNKDEIIKTREMIFHLTKFYSEQLSRLSFSKNHLLEDGKEIDEKKLYSREVNSLISIVARINTVRSKINNFMHASISSSEMPIIMTGHTLNEIDTTQFLVVYLDVDSNLGADRLFNRNTESYTSIQEAHNELERRNETDRINLTKKILPYLYGYIYIDTSNKSTEEIFCEFKSKINYFEKKEEIYNNIQSESINRMDFNWILNNALYPIKTILENMCNDIIEKYPYINKSDLIYQTLILLTSHSYQEIYECDAKFEEFLNNSIKSRTEISTTLLSKKIESKEIRINMGLLSKLLITSTLQLLDLYKDKFVQESLTNYNKEDHSSKIENKKGLIIKYNDSDYDKKIIYKQLDKDTSRFISKYCHYLHSPRDDEFIAYGAFIEGEEFPIAYVSFSRHDRQYKKELLYNIGIEPQNTLEMTRAWCSNSTPSNTMSSLFQYSINDIENKWKDMREQGLVDNNLQAITTTINPNLGFRASSFLGCNFIPIALRPAKFTFIENNDIIKYVTRRELDSDDEYFENQIEILPLNELILCLDKSKENEIVKRNIYIIEKENYDSVLNKNKKRKMKVYEKNINSNEKQR